MEKLEWKPVQANNHKNSTPVPRWGHACSYVNDEIVFFGGYAESIYMNDIWVFNIHKMEWSEVRTTGDIPSYRSNSSLNYDQHNNQIILFGGGSSNRNRFNTVHALDWQTKQWSIIKPSKPQPIPWERTYHSGELIYPYLIIFGGESIVDMDDLWVFNLETKEWKEIQIDKETIKPCSRRFHSSCVIGNQFFVIAGCHSKYRCISDIYSIDLTNLIQRGEIEGHTWKRWKDSSILRWGHTSSVYDGKIYIFGGRFCNDLNDIIVFDPKMQNIRTLKVKAESMPVPRRKPAACFVGSCFIMFGGFNNEYYNDLHSLNVVESKLKPFQELKGSGKGLFEMMKNSQFGKIQLQTVDDQSIECHKSILLEYVKEEQTLDSLLKEVKEKCSEMEVKQFLQCLYNGYGISAICKRIGISLPDRKEEKTHQFRKYLQTKYYSFQLIKYYQKHSHIELSDEDFADFLELNREKTIKDVRLIINKEFAIESNRVRLSVSSPYFEYLLSGKYKEKDEVLLSLPFGNVVLFQILINYILLGELIVPSQMSYQSWIELFRMADLFNIKQIQSICQWQIHSKIQMSNVKEIQIFSRDERLEELTMQCASYKLRNMEKNMIEIFSENVLELQQFENDMYLKRAYNLKRFDINQKLLSRGYKMKELMKKNSATTNSSEDKENYEICNQ